MSKFGNVYSDPSAGTDVVTATPHGIYDADSEFQNYSLKVYIERVWAFPTDARSNAFNFGVNYGKWLGVISSSNIKPTLVTPKKWQDSYQPLSKEKKKRKKELKEIAEEMFPDIRVTPYNCDALLIGAWAKTMGEVNES